MQGHGNSQEVPEEICEEKVHDQEEANAEDLCEDMRVLLVIVEYRVPLRVAVPWNEPK